MANPMKWSLAGVNRQSLVHSVRTAIAALISLVVARECRLPEAYWAAITTLVVMQSTLGAALTISWKRLAGTALGAIVGALVAARFGPSAVVFGATVFALGLICAVAHIDRSAYRFASITLAIIMLVARTNPAWIVALHRFFEVSVGIVVGLVLTAVWPENVPPVTVQPEMPGGDSLGKT